MTSWTTWASISWFSLKHPRFHIFAVLLALASIINLIIDIWPSPAAAPMALLLTLAALVQGVIALRLQTTKAKQIDVVPVPDFNSSISKIKCDGLYKDWIRKKFVDQEVIYHPRLNELLRTKNVLTRKRRHRFNLNQVTHEYAKPLLNEHVKHGRISNGKKVRLATDLTPESIQDGRVHILEKTSYYEYLLSNLSVNYQIQKVGQRAAVYDGLKTYTPDGLLPNLQDADLSNLLGGATILFTKDSYVIIQRQSRENRESAGLFTPSGAGSWDWSDVKRSDSNLVTVARRAIERELKEEMSIPKHERIQSVPLAYTRSLSRGGMPDFYFASYIDSREDQLRLKPERIYGREVATFPVRMDTREKFLGDLYQIIRDCHPLVSAPLVANLSFARDLALTDWKAVQHLRQCG